MLELRYLTEKERINISIQCEPFFLVSKETKQFKCIHQTLLPLVGRKYTKELWLVITAIVKAVKYGNSGTRFSLNKRHYVSANKIHKQKLSLDRTKKVLDVLDKEGYITYYKGFKVNDSFRMTTCLMITERLLQIINVENAKKFGLKRDPLSYIEIKDKDNKKILLSVRDFRGYSTVTKWMEKYNNLLARHVVHIPDVDTGEMVKCSTVYKRIFSGDLESAGRLYAMGSFQVKKSELRKFMTINNKPTTEVDYCNIHPRMLYTLEGIGLKDEWDAYCIPSLKWVCEDKKALRTFFKGAYLSILFSEDKEEAIKSVLQKANKSNTINIKNKQDAEKVVDEVLYKNKPISHYFFKDRLWAKLQNMDSRLATFIIDRHTKLEKVCLGWHDSFVVLKEGRDFLIESMREAWYSMFGTYMNFKYDIEF